MSVELNLPIVVLLTGQIQREPSTVLKRGSVASTLP